MEAVGYLFAFCLVLSAIVTVVYLAIGKKLQVQVRRHRVLHLGGPAGALAAAGEAEAGHRPLGRDDPGLRGRSRRTCPPTFNMDELISALKHRVDPEGVREIPIRKIGSNRLEIILPAAEAEEVEEVKRKLTDVGALEFRILANRKHDGDVDRPRPRPRRPDQAARAIHVGQARRGLDRNQSQVHRRHDHRPVAELEEEPSTPGSTSSSPARTLAGIEQTAFVADRARTRRTRSSWRSRTTSSRSRRTGSSTTRARSAAATRTTPVPSDPIIREEQVAPGGSSGRSSATSTARTSPASTWLAVYSTQDERLQPAVGFVFNRQGARKFGQLTREHLPEEGGAFKYQLAILLDNLVMSAPSINSEIRDQGIIEGGGQGFKAKEVEHLIKILQAGSLPASLNPEPLQEEKVGPTLGEDTIAKGIFAIWVSMLVVPIFMLVYYRFAGVVAVVALVLNMILLIGSMAFIQSTFSLPGLAGLALTIGMAVDANVLVFERMREEKERGAGLAQQIRNGFNRAWVTIFDSHVTNFLSSLVLCVGRHRGGQGLRPDHDHRHALEPVHRRLRLARDLRVLVSAGAGSRS